MKNPVVKTLMAVLLCAALVFNVACTADQVTNSLDNITSAVEIALPFVGPAAGVSAPLAAELQNYLSTVNAAADKSIDILAGKDGTPQSRAAQVIETFTAAVAASDLIRNLPAGQRNTQVVQAVLAVADAVERFLAHMHTAQSSVVFSSPYASAFMSHSKTVKVNRAKLAKLKVRIAGIQAKLAK
jgi:hypothetical protein